MVGPLTMKLGTLMRVHRNRNYKLVNKPHAIKTCKLYYITMKIGTLMFHGKSSSKQKLHNNNKQPQAILVNDVCAYNLLMVGPLTMKLGTLMYHDES